MSLCGEEFAAENSTESDILGSKSYEDEEDG